MTLLTDVSAEFHDLDANFCDDVRCARSALEVLLSNLKCGAK